MLPVLPELPAIEAGALIAHPRNGNLRWILPRTVREGVDVAVEHSFQKEIFVGVESKVIEVVPRVHIFDF